MNTRPKARRLALAAGGSVSALALLLAGAAPSLAASPNGDTVTITQHQHGTWTEPGDTDFCSGAAVSPTITGNEVEHGTYFTNSDEVWFTFTEEGSATFTLNGLTYSGRVTVWGNFNQNEQNQNSTFTASFDLSATDAQGGVHTEVGHQVAHVSWNAVSDQPVVNFEKMWMTCS